MTAHDWFDVCGFVSALTAFGLFAERRYWKRFARLMENRMIEARERASDAERASATLRRALHLIERVVGDSSATRAPDA